MKNSDSIAAIQTVLRNSVAPDLKIDGVAGEKTKAAWQSLVSPTGEMRHGAQATSFGDPKDVEIFKKYHARFKAQGMSDEEATRAAFKYGDNGIGYWKDDTTGATPCCALHKDHITERWGSLDAGKHKLVEVCANDKEVTCVLKDICEFIGRIDLNPGACAALDLKPPVGIRATWRWAS